MIEYEIEFEVEPDRFITLKTYNSEEQASEQLRRSVRNNPRGTYRLTRVITETTVLVTVVGRKTTNKESDSI